MKKIISTLLIILVISSLAAGAYATDESRHYDFILTCNGEDSVSAEKDAVVTIKLSLRCTDVEEDTEVSAFQTEICYDDEVLELVKGSMKFADGVNAVDIRTDEFGRRLRVSYALPGKSELFKQETEVMTFDLKVLDEVGDSDLTQENYLVSDEYGYDTYDCDAEVLTVVTESYIIPEYSVVFESMNGETYDEVLITEGATVGVPETAPVREGYSFAGWYSDSECTEVYNFSAPVENSITLYAKWEKNETPLSMWIIYAVAAPVVIGIILFLALRKKDKNKNKIKEKENN